MGDEILLTKYTRPSGDLFTSREMNDIVKRIDDHNQASLGESYSKYYRKTKRSPELLKIAKLQQDLQKREQRELARLFNEENGKTN